MHGMSIDMYLQKLHKTEEQKMSIKIRLFHNMWTNAMVLV